MGRKHAEVLVGQVLVREPWDVTIYGKTVSTPDLPGKQILSSERILVLSSGCVLVLWFHGAGLRLWFQVQLEVKVITPEYTPSAV